MYKTLGVAVALALVLTSSAALGSWKSLDWVTVGFALPAPNELCEERNDGPPCYRYKSAPWIGRMEVGRFRYEHFQWNIASGHVGLDWNQKERLGLGFGGVGLYWPLSDDGRHEVGFLVQPLSGTFGPTYGLLKSDVYYRVNLDHIFDGFFLEAGFEFTPIWNLDMSGTGDMSMALDDWPIHLHLPVGFQTFSESLSGDEPSQVDQGDQALGMPRPSKTSPAACSARFSMGLAEAGEELVYMWRQL